MNTRYAITAVSGRFPGASGPVGPRDYWANVQAARPARLESLEPRWGLRRSDYFDPRLGIPYRTYLDRAFTVADGSGSSQVEIGRTVIDELFETIRATQLPPSKRLGLCLATLWTDSSYFNADARRVLGPAADAVLGPEAQPFSPPAQLAAIAEAAGIAGPALAVDTACASSIYALDAAIGMIEAGRADAVAVMGLNAYLPAFLYLGFSKLTAMSPRGEILPFSSQASGMIPAEAVAAVLVEPLERAVRSGRQALAVVRGLGLSADGGAAGVFAPSSRGQQLAYERAYRDVDPASVGYIEGHGTATVVGDQMEIATLDNFFGPHRRRAKLPIGSVKALIGHTLASAGLASLIKALWMIREGVIPPHIDVQPHARLAESCLRLPERAEPWPAGDACRRVGVSSFGLGGANSHLVLSAAEPADLEQSGARGRKRSIPMAIVAADATLGEAHGAAAVRRALSGDEAPRLREFPWERFSSISQGEGEPAARGSFFPDRLETESAGLKMGPRPLAKLDPLQRLGIHLTQRVWREAEEAAEPEETAIVFCTNLGGETSLQLSRHYLAHFAGLASRHERYEGFEPSFEAIASSLTSLTSGFPAFHLGFKGFHETVSGGAATFWNALALGPYWLAERCSALVLAAGRHLKSPLDVESSPVPPGEGAAALLLMTAEEAERQGRAPLALIHGLVPCDDEDDSLEQALARTGFVSAAADLIEISQLDPSAEGAELGAAQIACGFLDEASGVEALLRALLAEGLGWRAVEIRDGARRRGWAVLEKLRDAPTAKPALEAPLPVYFQGSEAAAVAETAAADGSASSGRTQAVPPAAGSRFLEWQRAAEASMVSYFAAQRRLLELLAPSNEAGVAPVVTLRPLNALGRSEQNVVIASPLLDTSESGGGRFSARLVVDEAHPYFFDHPLDHVPGILILEGVLQLVELATPEDHFIRSIELDFKRFCEKDQPILLKAEPRPGPVYAIRVVQGGAEAAICTVETAAVRQPLRAAPEPADPGAEAIDIACPDPRYLHKLHEENILITRLEELEPGRLCACRLLPPLAGHVLDAGGAYHSLLYLFEAARQFAMLVAHQIGEIPLGMPMTLASIRLRLDEPAPRGEPLRFLCPQQPVQRIGRMTLANIAIELHGPRGRIGESSIKAQVVDKDVYLRQRGRTQ